jgi:signal transduction histidine kinase
MAERVNAVGGSVDSAALTGQGFRVHVTVPTTGQLPGGQG